MFGFVAIFICNIVCVDVVLWITVGCVHALVGRVVWFLKSDLFCYFIMFDMLLFFVFSLGWFYVFLVKIYFVWGMVLMQCYFVF